MSVPLGDRLAKRQKKAQEVFPNEYAENERSIWPFQLYQAWNGTTVATWTDDTVKCPFEAKYMKIKQITFQDQKQLPSTAATLALMYSSIVANGRPLFHVYSGMVQACDYTIPINLTTNSAATFSLCVLDANNPLVRDPITPLANSFLLFGGELWSKL